MSIISKLPAIFSSLALVNSFAIPFMLKKKKPEIIKTSEKNSEFTIVKEKPKRAVMPKQVNARWKEAMQYVECVSKESEEDLKKKKESCRSRFWFWDL